MNDKYIAERLAIIEMKLDGIASLKGAHTNLKECPFCESEIKYNFASDGAVVRKCGCSTGKTSIDINSFSQPSTK